tara:strand:+ start:1226 stop:1495 length:270 start_codon:yes stop_codon:yes gene_type:complete
MLPQEERDRIVKANDWLSVNGVNREASLWYERMGKFAEMQGKIWIGDCIWSYDRVSKKWSSYLPSKRIIDREVIYATTPELINEFLKIK